MGPRNTRNARARRHRRGTERAPLPERGGRFIFCNQKNTALVTPRNTRAPKTASAVATTHAFSRFPFSRTTALAVLFTATRQGADADSFREANWRSYRLVRFGALDRAERPARAPRVVFAFARARARRAVSRSRAPRVASRPARRLSTSAARRTRWRTFVTCRRSPSPRPRWRARRGGARRCRTRRTSPSARSEGCWRRAFRVRLVHGRARASASAPLPTALSDASVFLSSRAASASGSVAPGRTSPPPSTPSTPSFPNARPGSVRRRSRARPPSSDLSPDPLLSPRL